MINQQKYSLFKEDILENITVMNYKSMLFIFINPLLVWFGLRFNVSVNNFSVMSGRNHRFLGIYQLTLGSKCALLKDTTRSCQWGRTQDLSNRSPVLYHYAGALPYQLFLKVDRDSMDRR